MKDVKVEKTEVLSILKQNREKHRGIFLEALDGYKARVTQILEEKLAAAKAGKYFKLYIMLAEPIDQTKDYDRAIKMLEMSVDTELTLSEADFRAYIFDDWSWKSQFLASNAAYSMTATAALDSIEE